MKNLWAPWRMRYILGPRTGGGCVFCLPRSQDDDRDLLVVHRAETCFVMLNRFPYAAGHLMVIPYRHAADICDLSAAEAHELMDVVRLSCRALRAFCHPHGMNVGMNLGEAAGAGIGAHLHMHVVPRWNGDSNFIAVLDDIRVVPEALEETWDRLTPIFRELSGQAGRSGEQS